MTTFGPYTPVRQAGTMLFVSGQVGVNPKTKTAPEDIAGQTEQALRNLEKALIEAGANLDDVVKTMVFLTDLDDFTTMNNVYEKYFNPPRPARSAVGVRELPRVAGDTKLVIEIEAVAYKELAPPSPHRAGSERSATASPVTSPTCVTDTPDTTSELPVAEQSSGQPATKKEAPA
jgi:2-iminobutanoate/2-iminopropanoate deaminase